MKVRFEMTDRVEGTSQFDPPDDTLIRETTDPDARGVIEALNEFLMALYGPDWQVEYKGGDDDAIS